MTWRKNWESVNNYMKENEEELNNWQRTSSQNGNKLKTFELQQECRQFHGRSTSRSMKFQMTDKTGTSRTTISEWFLLRDKESTLTVRLKLLKRNHEDNLFRNKNISWEFLSMTIKSQKLINSIYNGHHLRCQCKSKSVLQYTRHLIMFPCRLLSLDLLIKLLIQLICHCQVPIQRRSLHHRKSLPSQILHWMESKQEAKSKNKNQKPHQELCCIWCNGRDKVQECLHQFSPK